MYIFSLEKLLKVISVYSSFKFVFVLFDISLAFVCVCVFFIIVSLSLWCRRDSFITHRAFCDALADESARSAMALNPLLSSYNRNNNNNNNSQDHQFCNNLALKRDFDNSSNSNNNNNNNHHLRVEIPPWLQPSSDHLMVGSGGQDENNDETVNPNPSSSSSRGCGASRRSVGVGVGTPNNPNPCELYQSSSHISATALLQKAAQMGATMSSTTTTSGSFPRPHNLLHVSTGSISHSNSTFSFSPFLFLFLIFFLTLHKPFLIYVKFYLLFIFLSQKK